MSKLDSPIHESTEKKIKKVTAMRHQEPIQKHKAHIQRKAHILDLEINDEEHDSRSVHPEDLGFAIEYPDE